LARSGADEQGFAGCFDDFLGDAVELVDVADARDLGEEALDDVIFNGPVASPRRGGRKLGVVGLPAVA
jgi:hypothetical protein